MPDLQLQDRVRRLGRLTGEVERLGTVVDVYTGKPNYVGASDTLYVVKWDDGRTQGGYLSTGLEKI